MRLTFPGLPLPSRTALEHGATAVEYAILVAVIGVVTIPAVAFAGGNLSGIVDTANTAIGGHPAEPAPEVEDYDCDFNTTLVALNSGSGSAGITFNSHVATDGPEAVAQDAVVGVSNIDWAKNWLHCGGSFAVLYRHQYQYTHKFHIVEADGATTHDINIPWSNAYLVFHKDVSPQVSGNNLVFTPTSYEGSPGDYPYSETDHPSDENLPNLLADFEQYYPGSTITVTEVKAWDAYRWYLDDGGQPASGTKMMDGNVVTDTMTMQPYYTDNYVNNS